MPSLFSTDVLKRCNLFGFGVFSSDGNEPFDRGVNVHRIAFPFDVTVEVGAQCKVSAVPFGTNSTSLCNAGKR